MDEAELTTFKVEVAHTFFRLNASEGNVMDSSACAQDDLPRFCQARVTQVRRRGGST